MHVTGKRREKKRVATVRLQPLNFVLISENAEMIREVNIDLIIRVIRILRTLEEYFVLIIAAYD
jgi:hypothetical protein